MLPNGFFRQNRDEARDTAVTEGELLFGALGLPIGRRRRDVLGAINNVLELMPAEPLPFDSAAAKEYGAIMVHRRSVGRPMEGHELDCQISAIAHVNRAAVATRNARDFTECGVEIINPWEATANQ